MKHAGFTLIELLICSAVLCILLVLSVPLSLDLYQKNRAEIIAGEIENAVRFARNLAFKNDAPMTLNPLSDSSDWSRGMVLFVDNPQHHFTAHDKIVHQWQWNYSGVRVTWKGFRSSHYITFSPILRQSTANGQFNIATSRQYQKQIIVNRLGSVRPLAKVY